ncbi:hypothetical protein ABZW96_11540 [Nocardia sp. NPDC004168]|uniref:hypothetical protein n=1 Tax=Nocardia sp. NPDC004168 TaxID=3154452 RepID=UPI0033A49267
MSEQTRGNVITLRGRTAEPLRPPRLTFARRCIWCGEADCQHPDCVALHEVSVWTVCRQCDGTGLAFSGPQGCTCAFGLIHVAPAVHRVLGVTGKGEVVTESGHWSSYNDRTYYEYTHPPVASKRVTPVVPLDAGTGEAVAL